MRCTKDSNIAVVSILWIFYIKTVFPYDKLTLNVGYIIHIYTRVNEQWTYTRHSNVNVCNMSCL